MDDAVRHRMRHTSRTEHAQAAHAHRAGGGAVAVEVADHDDMAIVRHGLSQQGGGLVQATHAVWRQQVGEAWLRLLDTGRPAGGVETTQQRRQGLGPLARFADLAPPQSRDGLHSAPDSTPAATNERNGLRQKRQRWPRRSV